MVELATHIVYYKYEAQEKNIQDVSPWRLLPLRFLTPSILPIDVPIHSMMSRFVPHASYLT